MKERGYEIVQRRCGLEPFPDRDRPASFGCPTESQDRSACPRCVCGRVVLAESHSVSRKGRTQGHCSPEPARLAGQRCRRHQAGDPERRRSCRPGRPFMGWRRHHGGRKRRKDQIAGVCRPYAPDKGESVHSATSKYPDPESLKTFVKDPDGYLTISEEGIKRYFAADLSPEEQAVVAATQGPFHIRTLAAPVSQAAWREKPTFMVV